MAQLWRLLEEPAAACGIPALTPMVQQALWQMLLQAELDVQFVIPGCAQCRRCRRLPSTPAQLAAPGIISAYLPTAAPLQDPPPRGGAQEAQEGRQGRQRRRGG